MNKYEKMYTWIVSLLLMLFVVGYCNDKNKSIELQSNEKILALEKKADSLQSVIDTSKSKEKILIKERERIKVVYKEKKVYVSKLDSVQQDSLFEELYNGSKDSANVKYYENEQCQEELAKCDSVNHEKTIQLSACEEQKMLSDSALAISKAETLDERKKRKDQEYKLYLWRSIGTALIAVDVFVVTAIILLK